MSRRKLYWDLFAWLQISTEISLKVVKFLALVTTAYNQTRDATYFDILRVGPEAGTAEVERAHASRTGALLAARLEATGLHDLLAMRDDVLACYDEARDALIRPALRMAYARAVLGR